MAAKKVRTITETERLQALGLLTLAASLNEQVDALEAALAELVGESDDGGYFGLVTDRLGEVGRGTSPSAALGHLLRGLDLTVESEEPDTNGR